MTHSLPICFDMYVYLKHNTITDIALYTMLILADVYRAERDQITTYAQQCINQILRKLHKYVNQYRYDCNPFSANILYKRCYNFDSKTHYVLKIEFDTESSYYFKHYNYQLPGQYASDIRKKYNKHDHIAIETECS